MGKQPLREDLGLGVTKQDGEILTAKGKIWPGRKPRGWERPVANWRRTWGWGSALTMGISLQEEQETKCMNETWG